MSIYSPYPVPDDPRLHVDGCSSRLEASRDGCAERKGVRGFCRKAFAGLVVLGVIAGLFALAELGSWTGRQFDFSKPIYYTGWAIGALAALILTYGVLMGAAVTLWEIVRDSWRLLTRRRRNP